jgi:hydroxymethylpyrimidine pyrophosphatase-like HAD family hydrolase
MTAEKNIWTFADVDDMLIATVRKAPIDGSQPAAVDDKGVVCGWLTPKQSRFLEMFRGQVNMVLTTARTSKGVSQLNLPVSGYAIVSFGGVIRRPDGSAEPRFRALMAAQCVQVKPLLSELLALIEATCKQRGINARSRIASDDGLDLFLSVKHNERNLDQLQTLREVLEKQLPSGWKLHHNGNFLAAMPPFLGKEIAVQWFIDNIAGGDKLTIGMGDSLTDLPFMELCDYAVMPTQSQSFSTLLKKRVEAPAPVRYASIH